MTDLITLTDKILILKGSPSSGNWGHVGIPKKHGGSKPGGGHRAVGVKPGSDRKTVVSAARKLQAQRQAAKREAKAKARADDFRSKLLSERKGVLENMSRDELLTLRTRIDSLLGESAAQNGRLQREKPTPAHGHVVTVLGADPRNKYEMRYEIRELDDLITSNTDSGAINPNFPKELQPRDRTRLASRTQVDQIARKLEPDAMLDEFKAIDRGTPIIGGDNVVESGNGRSMALRRAKEQYPDQFENYQKALRAQAESKGIDPSTLDQYNNPVLVRRRMSDVDRAKFAQEANTASILGTSDTERARSDAGRISSEHLQNITARDDIDQTIRSPQNRAFVRSFVANTPETERAAMMDRNGNLTRTGETRIKAAMFNRVYDSPALTDRIFESTDNDIKNVTNGVMNSLGPMSRAEELVRTGQRNKDLSLAPDISAAVDKFASLKEQKMSVANYLNQGALFGRDLSPTQERILVEIDRRSRSGKQIKELFDAWPGMVEAQPHPNQGALFGPAGQSKSELVDLWLRRANESPQAGIFKADIVDLAHQVLMVRRAAV